MIRDNNRINTPDLCTLLDYAQYEVKREINCALIGTILIFYEDTQTADIKLNYKIWQGEDKPPIEHPILVKCPVVVLGGGGSYISFPIDSGDTCIVLFCDRELDTWFINGGINVPQCARLHDLNDGIALIGVRNSIDSIANYPIDRSRWSHGGGYVDLKEGDLFSVPWTNYSATSIVIGWSSIITKLIYYKKIGNTVFVQYHILGTSDNILTTFTLPYTMQNNLRLDTLTRSMDNSGPSVVGNLYIAGSSALAVFYPDLNGNPWTASGEKFIAGQFWYEAV